MNAKHSIVAAAAARNALQTTTAAARALLRSCAGFSGPGGFTLHLGTVLIARILAGQGQSIGGE